MARQSLSFDTETVTDGLVCVECGYKADRTAGPGTPGPGAFALCIKCGSLNIFDAQMRFRMPTLAEYLAAAADRDVQRSRRAILAVNQQRIEDEQGSVEF